MKISKRYTMADLNSGKASLLDVYEDYVAEYVLAFAERMAREEHSEIAVVILVTSIFEPLGAMILGTQKSSDLDNFRAGLQFVFGSLPGAQDTPARVYRLLRHGLYHEGLLKAGLVLVADGEPIVEDGDILRVNVGAFLRETVKQFHAYVDGVRQRGPDSTEARNFVAFWRNRRGLPAPGVSFDSSAMPTASTAAPIRDDQFKREL